MKFFVLIILYLVYFFLRQFTLKDMDTKLIIKSHGVETGAGYFLNQKYSDSCYS